MDVEAACEVVGPKNISRVAGHRGRRWNRFEVSPVGPSELKRAVGMSLYPEALLVDGAVVAATEQGEVRERGGAALRPVADVMAIAAR